METRAESPLYPGNGLAMIAALQYPEINLWWLREISIPLHSIFQWAMNY
jgi:hypothetical protein